MTSGDRALEAFRRLLADGAGGGQAKVDALVALSQRTLFVATWTAGGEDYRTLTSSQQQSALPVFTDVTALQEAAARFGWLGPDGGVPHKEVGARQVFRYVLAHDLGFLLVDVASPHALECERAEVEPLIATRPRSESSGPFAAVGRISESMLQAVKPTRPSSVGGVPAPVVSPEALDQSSAAGRPSSSGTARPVGSASAPRPPSSTSGPRPEGFTVGQGTLDPSRTSATFGGGGATTQLSALKQEPSDDLLDALVGVLRGFPEVEWAALFLAARGPVQPQPTAGLRVDTAYRSRINEIIQGLRQAADAAGASLDVLLLDDPKLMRAARADGLLFFPWKRRA
ncbi:MAG: hypothetical protein H6724_12220 [Sandaracinus sp.]|nr:hypothetical protein [Sandaracinus sp.]MCB9620201.1 hypothetical protein [Sandaracinus sp.]